MGVCISLCSKCLILFKKKGGAEYEKLQAQMSPKPPPSTGLPANNSKLPPGRDEEEGGWDESVPMTIAVVPNSTNSVPALPSTSVSASLLTSTPSVGGSNPLTPSSLNASSFASAIPAPVNPRHARQLSVEEPPPPPPPEPDFFGNMGMAISSVQVTRVAAKKPLQSSSNLPSNPLADPSRNIYAPAPSATSNAFSSRFTDDLVEEVALGTKAGGSSWGTDDLDGLLGDDDPSAAAATATTAITAAAPVVKEKKPPRKAGTGAPREKKPKGIGAVAVALDESEA